MNTHSSERPRVLIVDDQKNWLEALCDMLDPHRYEIETATSYDQAKRQLRQRAFHVLVSDQRLVDAETDNIQGILLLDELSELHDGAQAIIVTGYPTIEAAKKALRGRQASDYILKFPEGGGPFNIREYREQVKTAADQAIAARKKAITLDFAPSTLVSSLTYESMAEILFPTEATSTTVENVRKVLNRLLYPLQPLARKMGKVWLSPSDHMCEILCWSRNQGQAILIRILREQSPLPGPVKRISDKKGYPLRKKTTHVSAAVAGAAYAIEDITFEDFVALVEIKED